MIIKIGKRMLIVKERAIDVANMAGNLMYDALIRNAGYTAEDFHRMVDNVETRYQEKRTAHEG